MRTKLDTWLKLLCLAVALVAAGGAAATDARAQQQPPPQGAARLQLDNETSLAQRASELIDVNLDENLLRIIPKRITTKTDEGKTVDVGSIITGLRGVYVRSYAFTNEGEYNEGNLSGVRAQLRSPGWARLVNIVKKKGDDQMHLEVYMMTATGRIDGIAILALEPKRLTLVNIVGTIDLEKLSQLEGQFGIPELGIGGSGGNDGDAKPVKKQ
ncbi:MAG TPA: DUF4252 domain-containing protein [Pyrinomonadaceae bacterium]|nr:DUF4252 domain-containing protein [Pyrinomonadaceae bacterium]